MSDFKDGLFVWVRGWAFILRNRSLILLVAIPFLISVCSAALAVTFIWSSENLFFIYLSSLLLGLHGTWFEFLMAPLLWLAKFLVTVLTIYFIYVAHTLLAQPFYSLMAERTRRLRGGAVPYPLTWYEMFRAAVIKGILFLLVGVMLFAASFVPGLNLIVMLATLLLVAYDCMDYSLEARGLRLRARFAYVVGHPAQWVGVAVGLALTLFIPGLTLLVIPGAVVGAALILKDEYESRVSSPKDPG